MERNFNNIPQEFYGKLCKVYANLKTRLSLDILKHTDDDRIAQSTERSQVIKPLIITSLLENIQKSTTKYAKLLGIELPKFSAELQFFLFF